MGFGFIRKLRKIIVCADFSRLISKILLIPDWWSVPGSCVLSALWLMLHRRMDSSKFMATVLQEFDVD